MARIVVIGTGTDVGKTYFSVRLVKALAAAQPDGDVVGIKPIETGVQGRSRGGAPPPGTDAFALEVVSRGTPIRPHPLLAFRRAVSAHLAARGERRTVSLSRVVSAMTLHATAIDGWQVVETAGGAFSPLGPRTTNFELALALEPAIWILVAPDALGVLHDVRVALTAMKTRKRVPDYLVLSAARRADASAGTNATELRRVGLPSPIAVLTRGERSSDGALARLIRALVRRRRELG